MFVLICRFSPIAPYRASPAGPILWNLLYSEYQSHEILTQTITNFDMIISKIGRTTTADTTSSAAHSAVTGLTLLHGASLRPSNVFYCRQPYQHLGIYIICKCTTHLRYLSRYRVNSYGCSLCRFHPISSYRFWALVTILFCIRKHPMLINTLISSSNTRNNDDCRRVVFRRNGVPPDVQAHLARVATRRTVLVARASLWGQHLCCHQPFYNESWLSCKPHKKRLHLFTDRRTNIITINTN